MTGGEADLLAPLRERFPGWKFWAGSATGNVWAMPPASHPYRELVCADDPAGLEAKVCEIESWRQP